MSRRESVGRFAARKQSASGPPVVDNVTVAVLPPRLPPGMAPPTGVGMADVFGWDESVNWQLNQPVSESPEPSRRKSFLKRAGLTTDRQRRNPDIPPYMFRVVPYEVWRKHYAKDKDGNYRGTHAPAEDCLLKPEDVKKWNIGDATTLADKWTRGKEALPVYAEVEEAGHVPEYEVDYDVPPREGAPAPPPTEAPVITQDEDELARLLERLDTMPLERSDQNAAFEQSMRRRQLTDHTSEPVMPSSSSVSAGQRIDGKTSAQIIAEAQAKRPAPKSGWKSKLQRGLEMASMGPV